VEFPYSFFDFSSPNGALSGKNTSDVLRQSDVTIIALFVCFLLIMALWRVLQPRWRDAISNFLFPTPQLTDLVKAKRREGRRMLIAILFCIESALLTSFLSRQTGLANYTVPPAILLVIYALVFLAYLAFKQFFYHLLHGIFFTRNQSILWRNHFAFLFCMETIVMFPLLLVIIFLQIDIRSVLFVGVITLLFVKIVLLFKCFSTFFRKKYGFLHLFVYFCTLEGTPAVMLVASLIEITRNLTLI